MWGGGGDGGGVEDGEIDWGEWGMLGGIVEIGEKMDEWVEKGRRVGWIVKRGEGF